MIVLLAKNTLLQGKQEDFIATAKKLAEETRKEPGCLSYELVQEEKTVFYFVEKYKDEAALEFHRNSAHFQKYVPMFNAFRAKPSEVTKCFKVDI